MEQQNEDVWYSYYLCKGRKYLLGEIKKIDNEYLLKIESYDFGVIFFTSNYSYRFERTNSDGYIFKERANLDDKTKIILKELEPLTEREGHCYYYSDKDLKLESGHVPTLDEKFEIIRHKFMRIRKLKEGVNLDDKEKFDLKTFKSLIKREDHDYYYSDKDLKVEGEDYLSLDKRIERIQNKLQKLKRKYNKKNNYEDDCLD